MLFNDYGLLYLNVILLAKSLSVLYDGCDIMVNCAYVVCVLRDGVCEVSGSDAVVCTL